MLRKVATLVSIAGHPVFLFLGVVLFFQFSAYPFYYLPQTGFLYLLLLVLFNTILLPVGFTYLVNGELWLGSRARRFVPFLGTLVFYLATWYCLLRVDLPLFMLDFLLALAVGIAVLLVLNYQWKVSLHTTGQGALLGLLTYLYATQPALGLLPLVMVVLIAGMVGSARLYLDCHTPGQVYWGYGIGLVVMLGLTLL